MSEEYKLGDDVRKEIKDNAEQGSGFNGQYFRAKRPFRAALSKPMPPEAIQKHPSKSFLSTIKAIFIIERLNEVFGILGWDFEHEVVGQFDNTDKDGNVEKQIVVRGRIYIREFDLYTPVQYGGKNLDGKGQEPVDAFKSAVTDALTKCASFLEIGIQVFKGKPQDQTANKSRRAEQNEEPPKKEEVKKEVEDEPSTDNVEMEELMEKHKQLFGKNPNKNWSAEAISERIEKELERIAEPVNNVESKEGSEPENDNEIELKHKNAEGKEIKPNTDFDNQGGDDAEEVEEVDAEDVYADTDEPIDHVGNAKKAIDSYLDPNELKDAASDLVFDAKMDGATDDELNKIKLLVNEKYKTLIQ